MILLECETVAEQALQHKKLWRLSLTRMTLEQRCAHTLKVWGYHTADIAGLMNISQHKVRTLLKEGAEAALAER